MSGDRWSLVRHIFWMVGLVALLCFPIIRFGPWRHR